MIDNIGNGGIRRLARPALEQRHIFMPWVLRRGFAQPPGAAEPTPIGRRRGQCKRRNTNTASDVKRRILNRYDRIHGGHLGRKSVQILDRINTGIAMNFDAALNAQCLDFPGVVTILQIDPGYATISPPKSR